MKRDVGPEREKRPMRRSRRWIELSAAAGKISQEPRGREGGDVPADHADDAVPLDEPGRAQGDNDTLPPAPLMLLSEMSVLAARIALRQSSNPASSYECWRRAPRAPRRRGDSSTGTEPSAA